MVWLKSVNPANANEIIGRVRKTTIAEADKAIDNAARFFPEWRDTPARKRAEILFRQPEIMREQRWELAAREIIEVGKGWREADADVARPSTISIIMVARCCGSPNRARPSSCRARRILFL